MESIRVSELSNLCVHACQFHLRPKRSARTPTTTGGAPAGAGKKTSGPIRKGRGATMKVAAQPYNRSSGNYNRGQWQGQQQQSSYGSGGKSTWQQQQSGGGGSGYRNSQGSYYGSTSNNNNKSWGGSWGGNWSDNRGGNNQSWNQHDNRGNDYNDNNNKNTNNKNGSYYARNDTGYRQQQQQQQNNNNAVTPQQQSRGGGVGGRRRVVVTNIPYDLTWREIKQAFSSVGTVVHCEVDSSGPKGASANLTFSGTKVVEKDGALVGFSSRLFAATCTCGLAAYHRHRRCCHWIKALCG